MGDCSTAKFSRVSDFSAVWTAILNGNVTKSPENSRLWSLPEGIEWIGDIKTLYNRPCYDDMIASATSVKRMLIIGTPGIGKTLFLQVFLVFLAERARAAGQPPPSIQYIYTKSKNLVVLSLLSDGTVIDVTNDGNQQPPDCLLSDSVDLESPYGKILSLEVASDKDANYNKFQKRVEEARERGIKRVMPLFSFEELGYVFPHGTSMLQKGFRYEVFGGSARNVLDRQKRPDVAILHVVDETMTMLFPDIKMGDFAAWEEAAKQVSEQLLSSKNILGNPMTPVNSMMWHMQSNMHKTWASKYMEWLAAAIVDRRGVT
jgi:hypothetical protein